MRSDENADRAARRTTKKKDTGYCSTIKQWCYVLSEVGMYADANQKMPRYKE